MATAGCRMVTIAAGGQQLTMISAQAGGGAGECSSSPLDLFKQQAFFSAKQQRNMKAFSLKALRPLLRNSPVSHSKSVDVQAPPEHLIRPPYHKEASDGNERKDPLPLHALLELEEARAHLRLGRSESKNPFDSALKTVDWMMFAAQDGLQNNGKPKAGRKKEIVERKLAGEVQPDRIDTARSHVRPSASVTSTSITADAPTKSSGTSSGSPAVSFPRCSWPRDGALAGSPAVASASSTSPTSSSANPFARCSWPRSSDVTAPVSETREVASSAPSPMAAHSLAVETLERSFVADQSMAWLHSSGDEFPGVEPAPQCPWPRGGVRASTASTITSPRMVAGPRCAWPKSVQAGLGTAASTSATANLASQMVAPHCAFPRKRAAAAAAMPGSEAMTAGAGPLKASPESSDFGAPRCPWPRSRNAHASATSSSESASVAREEVVAGPRCAWPRGVTEGGSSAKDSLREDLGQSEVVAGPRCPWPR